jgi:hypothetical protein
MTMMLDKHHKIGVYDMVQQMYNTLITDLQTKFPLSFRITTEMLAFSTAVRMRNIEDMQDIVTKLKDKIEDYVTDRIYAKENPPNRDTDLEQIKNYRQNLLKVCDDLMDYD